MAEGNENIILHVENFKLGFSFPEKKEILKGINFDLPRGEITALLGPSGSGKSLTALCILGLDRFLQHSWHEGDIIYMEEKEKYNIPQLDEKKLQQIRGKKIAMLFQDAYSTMDPRIKCGKQILEIICTHTPVDKKKGLELALEKIKEVGLPSRVLEAYPHELSGGQLQRVALAIALAAGAKLLIADEPTTNLDSIIKKDILDLLKEINKKNNLTVLHISHDYKAVKYVADNIIYMEEGKIRIQQPAAAFFSSPFYSKISSIKIHKRNDNNFEKKEIILEVENLKKYYKKSSLFSFGHKNDGVAALKGISFSLRKNEILAVAGESGSGKSTLAKILAGLEEPDEGTITVNGKKIDRLDKKTGKFLHRHIQIVFQNPQNSLDPLMKTGDLLLEAAKLNKDITAAKRKMMHLLELTGLDKGILNQYPGDISGGEAQRIALIRALILNPEILILDESLNALDRYLQYDILNVILKLQQEEQFSIMFITHDITLVKDFCDSILVLYKGEVVDYGDVNTVFEHPASQYTKLLVRGF